MPTASLFVQTNPWECIVLPGKGGQVIHTFSSRYATTLSLDRLRRTLDSLVQQLCHAKYLDVMTRGAVLNHQEANWDLSDQLHHQHPNYVGSLERGERNISICNIARIAAALGISMSALLAEPETLEELSRN